MDLGGMDLGSTDFSLGLTALWLAALAETDRRCGRLPNVLLWPAALAVGGWGATHPQVLLAAGVAAAPYLAGYAARLVGGGDVKFAFVLGGLLADPLTALVMVLVAQVPVLAVRRRGARPHGPAMASAALALVVMTMA
ncbi:MAG: prepilin peptidase [Gordonia sp. (in: high G+C Gram-positive bacteria)]